MNIVVGYVLISGAVFGGVLVLIGRSVRDAEHHREASERAAHRASAEAQRRRNDDEENRRFVLSVTGSQIEDWSYGELTALIEDGWMELWTYFIDLPEIVGVDERIEEELA